MVTINPMLTATLGCVLLEQPSKLPLKTTQCCFATLGVLVCCEEAVLSCFAWKKALNSLLEIWRDILESSTCFNSLIHCFWLSDKWSESQQLSRGEPSRNWSKLLELGLIALSRIGSVKKGVSKDCREWLQYMSLNILLGRKGYMRRGWRGWVTGNINLCEKWLCFSHWVFNISIYCSCFFRFQAGS